MGLPASPMDLSPASFPPSILILPREIRDQILSEVFFPGEKQPENTSQDGLGLAPTAVRQIFPYKTGIEKSSFDVAIFRTCKQLQHEAEDVLYGTSSWNLMYRDWDDPVKLSYEFFQALPKRLRRLVRRVERKCYSVHYRQTISLFDWTLFMTFLARECPNLQSLKLWGPGDRFEGPGWVASCHKDAEWVQAILQIKTLRYFDIPVIAGGVIYEHPEFKDDFLPWLKYCLLEVESTDDFLPWLKGALKPKTFELNDTSLAVGNRPKPFPSSRLDAYDQIGAINDAAKSFPLLEFDAIDTPNASIFGANDQGSAADSEVKPFPLINLYVNEGLEPTAYPTNDQPLAADEGVNLFPCVKPDALKDPQPRILRENDQKSAADSRGVKPSPFFKIDAKIRDKIYRMVLLPPKKRIHPYIKPWFDLTTKNLISLFLTCKQIHQEAETLFYTEAVFTSPISKYDQKLQSFLKDRSHLLVEEDNGKKAAGAAKRRFLTFLHMTRTGKAFRFKGLRLRGMRERREDGRGS